MLLRDVFASVREMRWTSQAHTKNRASIWCRQGRHVPSTR